MKLACSSQIAPGDGFLEKFTNVMKFGFDGMEIRITSDEGLDKRAAEVIEGSAETGMMPSSLLVPSSAFRRPLVDEEALLAKKAHIKEAARIAGMIGCPVLMCPEYGCQDPLPLFSSPKRYTSYEKELFLELIEFADAKAKEYGTSVLLEPINRYETHFNHRLEHAKELIQEAGAKHVKILADFFHMNIEESDIPRAIKDSGGLIGHVHLADNNRLLPGKGRTDFASGFKALKDIGYEGFLALECIIPDDIGREMPGCVKFLRAMWA